jgi:hypothetical protein
MALRKTYQAIGFKTFDTYELVKGQKVLIQFRSASHLPNSKGQFTTSDPDLIEAMDNSSSYGISFTCVRTDEIEGPAVRSIKVDEPTPTPAPAPTFDDDEESDLAPEKVGITKVADITTIQAARDYLVKNHGAVASKLPNGPAVKKFAAERKIEFIDLT